jgi:hypothetical protein
VQALRHLFSERLPLETTDHRLQSLVHHLLTSDESLDALSMLRASAADMAMQSLQSVSIEACLFIRLFLTKSELQWMDQFPEHSGRYKILRALMKVAVAQREMPGYLYIKGLQVTAQQRQQPVASGGFGDVYQGSYQGKPVAVKRLVKCDGKAKEDTVKVGNTTCYRRQILTGIVASVSRGCIVAPAKPS